MFHAARTTKRFNVNQKVWVRYDLGNCLRVWFRFRGNGRYVSGTVGRFSKCVGEIREIEVDDALAARIEGKGE
jgi:hypothetical protein